MLSKGAIEKLVEGSIKVKMIYGVNETKET